VRLFGPTHLALVAATALAAILLAAICRRRAGARRGVRLAVGCGLLINELVWWVFRYSHEGVHLPNLPLQLCDVTLWASVLACLTLRTAAVEFAYFAGMAGAGMALLTPDLWSPWPSYPAIYFFVAHGGIVIACAVLVFGGIAPLRPGALWRAFGMLLGYAALVGAFNAIFHTNYMYMCQKPKNASLLNVFGPWPVYLAPAAVAALALFWLLWLPARRRSRPATFS
jgi:hypothetical integral membrane protein (TIGR02206 family)